MFVFLYLSLVLLIEQEDNGARAGPAEQIVQLWASEGIARFLSLYISPGPLLKQKYKGANDGPREHQCSMLGLCCCSLALPASLTIILRSQGRAKTCRGEPLTGSSVAVVGQEKGPSLAFIRSFGSCGSPNAKIKFP